MDHSREHIDRGIVSAANDPFGLYPDGAKTFIAYAIVSRATLDAGDGWLFFDLFVVFFGTRLLSEDFLFFFFPIGLNFKWIQILFHIFF